MSESNSPPKEYRIVVIVGAIEDPEDSDAEEIEDLTHLKFDMPGVLRSDIMGPSYDPALQKMVQTFESMVYGIDPPSAQSANAEQPQPAPAAAEERQPQKQNKNEAQS